MPKTSAKKPAKATTKVAAKKVNKSMARPKRVIAEKPLLFKEVELGAMGVFVVVLIILLIGVAGSLALSFASSSNSVNREYPLLYRLLYPVDSAPVKVRKSIYLDATATPAASAIPVKISK